MFGVKDTVLRLNSVSFPKKYVMFVQKKRRGNFAVNLFYVFVLHNSISTIINRGHNFKLFKPQYSLDVRKCSFAYRVIDIWNSLSSDTVACL